MILRIYSVLKLNGIKQRQAIHEKNYTEGDLNVLLDDFRRRGVPICDNWDEGCSRFEMISEGYVSEGQGKAVYQVELDLSRVKKREDTGLADRGV